MRTALLAALLVTACATQNPRGEVRTARGPAPDEAAAVQLIQARVRDTLKDPDSLQFELVSGPHPLSWSAGGLFGGPRDEAWLYCFKFNGKNSLGGYAGAKIDGMAVRIEGGKLYPVYGVVWSTANEYCR